MVYKLFSYDSIDKSTIYRYQYQIDFELQKDTHILQGLRAKKGWHGESILYFDAFMQHQQIGVNF